MVSKRWKEGKERYGREGKAKRRAKKKERKEKRKMQITQASPPVLRGLPISSGTPIITCFIMF